MTKARIILAAFAVVVFVGVSQAQEVTVPLTNYGPNSDYRWLDVSDQPYAASYRGSYTYDQATVELSYSAVTETFVGTLTARNLKPNFAYQVKLIADAGSASGEWLGLTGRWWEQEWLGSEWSIGWNLNTKGDGSSPNPNDDVYNLNKNTVDVTSPTGLKYKYSGYRVIDYFITDKNGDADIAFAITSSYHVLWRTGQSYIRTASDGPLVSRTFDPDPFSEPAYDSDYGQSTAEIFGEWERLPMGGIALLPGDYTCQIMLTEESFHGSGLAGFWAAAVVGDLSFSILDPSVGGGLLALFGNELQIASGDLSPSYDDHTRFGRTDYKSGSITRTFTIRNDGASPVTILDVTVLGPDRECYAVTRAPDTPLGSGTSTEFDVSFDPDWKGEQVATVVVSADDGGIRHYTFAIAGTGTATVFYSGSSGGGGCTMSSHGAAAGWGLWCLLLFLTLILRGCMPHSRRELP